MKKLALAVVMLICLSGCFSDKKNDRTQTDSVKQIADLKEEFIPVLKGVWVQTDYLEEIKKTHSPLKSADLLQGVVGIVINGTVKSDSLAIDICWNNHEGDKRSMYLQQGQNVYSLKTNIPDYEDESSYYELGYETIDTEKYLFLYHYSKQNKLLDKRSFSKVADRQPTGDISWGLQYAVNKIMIAGTYQLTDNTNKTTAIKFESNGTISGNPIFKSYRIRTDFLGGPMPSTDLIDFDQETGLTKEYAFQVKNDGIYLYSTKGNEETGEPLQIDKIQYKLIKK